MDTLLDQVLEGGNRAFGRQQVDVHHAGFQHAAIDAARRVDLFDGHGDTVQPVGLIGHTDGARLRGGHPDQDRVGRKGRG